MMDQLAPVAPITGDVKIYQCHVIDVTTPIEKCPTSIKELFYCLNLITVSPL